MKNQRFYDDLEIERQLGYLRRNSGQTLIKNLLKSGQVISEHFV